ncbi:hypothetical protein [Kribbella sp. DT2]|uniref:hypothetical protein n=1 Tax=Kribbella sp. DT2 TaxID=3393427 RepID=UPI003CF39082
MLATPTPAPAAHLSAEVPNCEPGAPAKLVENLHLARRARLSVWPDLSPDVEAAHASIDGTCEYVWENRAGEIRSVVVLDADVDDFPDDVIAAAAHPITEDEYNPLVVGVLPDPDGVLRARWSAI